MTGVFLVLLGIGIHFLGFRIALQVRPQLARVMGDVITADEQNAIELEHQKKLERLTQTQTVALAQREKKQKELSQSLDGRKNRKKIVLTGTGGLHHKGDKVQLVGWNAAHTKVVAGWSKAGTGIKIAPNNQKDKEDDSNS